LILKNRKNAYTGDCEARIANLRGTAEVGPPRGQQFSPQLSVVRIPHRRLHSSKINDLQRNYTLECLYDVMAICVS
jgi:hypothetical protein